MGYDTEAPSWGATAQDAWGGINVESHQGVLSRDFVSGGFTWTGWDYKGEPTPTTWPSVTSHFGIIDTAGFWKDRTYWYNSWFKPEESELYLFPHWTGWEEGSTVNVWAYSNLAEIELFVNGDSQGRQQMDTYSHVEWDVTYSQGEVEVRGYDNVGDIDAAKIYVVKTAGKPSKLRATIMDGVGTDGVSVSGLDVAKVKVEVLDSDDNVVPVETSKIVVRFDLSSNGILVGTGNGNNADHDPDVALERSVYHGTVMAWVKADRHVAKVGDSVQLKVSADGLDSDEIELFCIDKVRELDAEL
jgi:beta-galactosidase